MVTNDRISLKDHIFKPILHFSRILLFEQLQKESQKTTNFIETLALKRRNHPRKFEKENKQQKSTTLKIRKKKPLNTELSELNINDKSVNEIRDFIPTPHQQPPSTFTRNRKYAPISLTG